MVEDQRFHFYTTGDLRGYYERSNYARAYCPVHGGDRQKSLKIDMEGDYVGFGRCFNCDANIVVVDLNPDAARRLGYDGDIPARQAFGSSTPAARPEKWQSIEMKLLQSFVPHMRRALPYDRPRAYLVQRGVSFDLAETVGLMYLPIPPEKEHKGCLTDGTGRKVSFLDENITPCAACRLKALRKWHDRIIFPLASPDGHGFIGRALYLWEPGMNEGKHRDLLKEHNNQMHETLDYAHEVKPYEKTNPAGCFNYEAAIQTSQHLTIVEGSFDALALLMASIPGVIALCGTSIDAKAIPIRIERVTLALDGDDAGYKATKKLRKDLWQHGIDVDYCTILDDGMGKDWSERYRRHGRVGLQSLFDTILQDETLKCSVSGCIAEAEHFYVEHVESEDATLLCEKHYQEWTARVAGPALVDRSMPA